MAEIVIVADLPVSSADDIDTTELALILRDIKAAQIIDFIDSSRITMSMVGGETTEYNEYYEGQ